MVYSLGEEGGYRGGKGTCGNPILTPKCRIDQNLVIPFMDE